MKRLINFGEHKEAINRASNIHELRLVLMKFVDDHQKQTDDIIEAVSPAGVTRRLKPITVRKAGDVDVPIDPPMANAEYKIDPTLLRKDPVTGLTVQATATPNYSNRTRSKCVVNCSETGTLQVSIIPF